MDRCNATIIVLLIALIISVWWATLRLSELLSTLQRGRIIVNVTNSEPDKSPEADPAHPRDQSLG
jgi:hypothetical protein